MQDNSQFITSQQAVDLWRSITGRKRASRQALAYWAVRGLIRTQKIHTTCFLYDRNDVEQVAKRLCCGGAE